MGNRQSHLRGTKRPLCSPATFLFERYKFNSSTQKGETVDEFVVKLRQLAEQDSLIRDRLVIGTTDDVCRDRLLRERPVPDLNRCIECLRASELSRSHKQHMSTLGKESIDYMHGRPVHKNKSYQQKGKQPATQPNTQKPTPTTGDDCHWCGAKPAHPRKTCPARDAAGVGRPDITAINASRASQNPSTKYRMKTTSTWHF